MTNVNMTGLVQYLMMGVQDSGGATVNIYGFSPADGFMVGGVVTEKVVEPSREGFAEREALRFILDNVERLEADPELFVGIWQNPKSGMLHLDISERFPDRLTAGYAAYVRDEIAFYDLSTKTTIPTTQVVI